MFHKLNNQQVKDHIINSLPDIIRLDKTFDSFSKATGFDLADFNDAVIIRKKDLVCLSQDGVVTDEILITMYKNLASGLKQFVIRSNSGFHTYELIPLDNSKNPFGDNNKACLYALARKSFASKNQQFVA